jgi:hypothetical protein
MSEQKPLAPLTGSAIGEAEKTRRRNILAGINARKRAKAKKRRMPNTQVERRAPSTFAPTPGSASEK